MRNPGWAGPAGGTALIAVALAVTACGTGSGSSAGGAYGYGTQTTQATQAAPASPSSVSTVALKTETTRAGTVLADNHGLTLYWFAIDTPSKSNCSGSCATFWPPVTGPVTAGSGVTGTLGTITRSDGTKQATYLGHPLYTYVGDKAPGDNKGNGLNISGGLWWEMTVSGSTPPANAAAGSTSSPKSTATSGGGGYGY